MSIPKKMLFIWVGSKIPVEFYNNIRRWEILNRNDGWEVPHVWTESNRPDLYNEHLYRNAERYVPDHCVGQFRADILRYELLYNFGGFYADVDTQPLRPLGDVFDDLTEFAVMEDPRWIANTYLASEAGNSVLLDLCARLRDNAELFRGSAAARISGPQYLTPIWRAFGAHTDTRTELWFPYSWSHVRAGIELTIHAHPDAYASHQWAHQRELRGNK